MATTFVDGTTPLNAAAMNGIEDEIADLESSVDTKLGTKLSLNYASYTTIDSGTDLNDITSYGNYVCTASATAATIENCPVGNVAFILIVMQGISTSNRFQFIFSYEGNKAYIRTYYSTAWNSWRSLL